MTQNGKRILRDGDIPEVSEAEFARAKPLRSACQDATVEALFDRLAQLPVVDNRSPDEMIGYGPDGLPR
ncbi:MAG TPA: hypothetical protein VII49_09365 [Rhizomicrobium sp.]